MIGLPLSRYLYMRDLEDIMVMMVFVHRVWKQIESRLPVLSRLLEADLHISNDSPTVSQAFDSKVYVRLISMMLLLISAHRCLGSRLPIRAIQMQETRIRTARRLQWPGLRQAVGFPIQKSAFVHCQLYYY